MHEATHAIADSARTGEPCALFLLDLDRFKEVNDALGHQVGDAVLRAVATRLTGALRPEDLVARLGGDEFAVLLRRVRDVEAALEVAVRLQAALDVPLEIDGQAIDLEGSIGVALVPDHADAYEVLFTRADIAMYLAKHERTGVEVYESSRDESSASRMGIISGLRTAIERGQARACTTSRRRRSTRSGWSASRRWCAGGTPCAASCRPTSSSPSPSSRA
ncbi:hypothetical protein GCM10025868_39600 [Angustibacter aerolatus]|uniref:GGDEF domain-containing protein n=1 Tax=Angustibacter aerolatus TaxID=1162965 RepID=A0ABQ6JKC5_9ACTN|nr:hypothetical protein GCM10025868_39600 [Angustibacter aerolatus]